MKADDYNNIIERLSYQVKSFQEGFAILTKSNSIQELGTNFCHILRGSILISDVNIFYKNSNTENWQSIKQYNEKCLKEIPKFKISENVEIEYYNESEFSIISTLPLNDGSYLGLIIGNKVNNTEITELDKITFQMFLQLLDNAYQSYLNQKREKQLNFSLNHRVVQLNSLIDTGIEISKLHNDSSSLLELSLERAVSLTNASFGLLQINSGNKNISQIVFPQNSNVLQVENSPQKISTEIEFNEVKYRYTLSEKESRKGIINFDETDEILLAAFARQVLASIENEHLHNEALDKERMHQEIETAAAIQRRIIPQYLPSLDGYELAGINVPSLEIGGDYYDVTKLNDGRYLFIIADVAGKGVASGLLVNTLNASLNVYVENDFDLIEVANRLNKIIYKASTPEKYITAFIALLEPDTGNIEYINAGHNPIFYFSNEKIIKLDKGGLAFGMLDFGLPYESAVIKLEPGQKILFYTDGITEAMNEFNEEYSDERLELFFVNGNYSSADEFINELMNDIKKHTKLTPQSDDITALYLIRKN